MTTPFGSKTGRTIRPADSGDDDPAALDARPSSAPPTRDPGMGVDAGRTGAGEKETSRTGTGENGTGGKDGIEKETGGEDGGATGDDTYGSEDVAAYAEEDVEADHQETDGAGYYEGQDSHTAPAEPGTSQHDPPSGVGVGMEETEHRSVGEPLRPVGPDTSRLELHGGLDDDGPSGSLFTHDPLDPPDPDPGFDDDPDDPFDDLG
ncbi:MAG: hypothetical protein AB7O92_01710 [Acidimicrobiia bacterium]